MHLKTKFFLATIVLLLTSVGSHAETLVRKFNGTSSTVTSEFEVRSPWLLDWRLNGDYPGMLAIDIMLLDGRTGKNEGQILHTKRVGNGVKLFKTSGRYKLRVDATLAKWELKVIQLTAAEAELYTPRKDN